MESEAGYDAQSQAAGGARLGVRELSRTLSGVINDVATSGQPAIVTRHGVPIAALVPIEFVELAAAAV
jgi:prevent-host-death family protein